MTDFLTYTVLGLVLASVYAIAASGLVMTYTTSGVFNLAHGAQAMTGAFVYYQLNSVWGVPEAVSVLLVLLVLGPGLGLLLYAAIMRRLRDTDEITKIVVTVAVLLGLLALSQWLWNPQEARVPEAFFGAERTVDIAGVAVRYHEVLCLAVALALAGVLRWLFVSSRLGVLMRATVDDPGLVRLAGHDPDRVSALSWMLGSMLAVLAGMLITPVVGGALEASSLTLLVIDASAAALFGRLRSIPMTFVGAILLGLTSTYFIGYAPTEWSWVSNLRVALPMVMLFVFLLLLPQTRLRVSAVRSRERYETPPVGRAAIWALVLVVAVVAFRRLIDASSVGTLQLGMAFAILALSVTLLTGYSGEVNLAPFAFGAVATIAAFHAGISGAGMDARMSVGGLVVGVLAAAATGAIVALPAMRLRGLYLALATLAFGVIVSTLVMRETTPHTILGRTFTLVPNGTLIVPRLEIGPLDLADQDTFLYATTVVFAGLGVGIVGLRNSSYGRRLAAMKDSPAASAMLGQRLIRLKLGVFAASTAIAGLGGIFMSMVLTSVGVEQFAVMAGLSLVMLTVVGGIGYVSGALFGGLVAGAGMTASVGFFGDLARGHPAYAGSLDAVSHLILVATALVGVGVARQPSGILHDVFAAHRRLAAAPEIRAGGLVGQGALYALAWAGPIDTPLFVVLSLALWLALPRIGAALRPAVVARPEGHVPHVSPELVGAGIDPSPAYLAWLDEELGLRAASVRVAAHPVVHGEDRHVAV